MKKLTFIIIAILIGFNCKAQQTASRYDLRVGMGRSFLGSGDILTFMVENELNAKLNNYFALSGGLAYAKSDQDVSRKASFVQLNVNIYLSPFGNDKRNDFRVGTGLSWYSIDDLYLSSSIPIDPKYVIDQRTALGLNVVIENTYALTDKFLLGFKLFTQPYRNGDINSGGLIKFGIRI